MKTIQLLLLCLLTLSVSSCKTTGPVSPPPAPTIIDSGCYWSKPIYISADDKMTPETKEQILAHNLTGKTRCGWKPNTKK